MCYQSVVLFLVLAKRRYIPFSIIMLAGNRKLTQHKQNKRLTIRCITFPYQVKTWKIAKKNCSQDEIIKSEHYQVLRISIASLATHLLLTRPRIDGQTYPRGGEGHILWASMRLHWHSIIKCLLLKLGQRRFILV